MEAVRTGNKATLNRYLSYLSELKDDLLSHQRSRKSLLPTAYQEGAVSEDMCQSHLFIGLIPTACPHKHRDIGVVRMVLQGGHCDPIAKVTDLQVGGMLYKGTYQFSFSDRTTCSSWSC